MTIAFEDFAKVDVRIGTVTGVDPCPEARKPALKLAIDFGPEIGVKRSSARTFGSAPASTNATITFALPLDAAQ